MIRPQELGKNPWNGTLPGTAGTFEAYLRSLPPVIGLGFGGYGEWSKEVDSLIGQLESALLNKPFCHLVIVFSHSQYPKRPTSGDLQHIGGLQMHIGSIKASGLREA